MQHLGFVHIIGVIFPQFAKGVEGCVDVGLHESPHPEAHCLPPQLKWYMFVDTHLYRIIQDFPGKEDDLTMSCYRIL